MKDAGALFRLNYSIHQTGIGCDDTSSWIVGTIFNLAKVNTITCMCATALSLSSLSFGQRVDGWLE